MATPDGPTSNDPPVRDRSLRFSSAPGGVGPPAALLRLIDAAANRAAEGFRVIEDYLRFVLDDGHLTATCKALRHELHAVLRAIRPLDRYAARATQADVGTDITTAAEGLRADAWDVCAAGFSRVAQSLRSLEEYAKVLQPDLGGRFEAIRYRLYTLHQASGMTQASVVRLQDVRLLVLVDGRGTAAEFSELVEELIAGGAHAVQLRDKALGSRALADRARRLRAATRGTSTLMFINDAPDLAVVSHADGVHVGQEDLDVKDVRTVVGPRTLVGVSTHSLDQARQAVCDGANLIGVGPTFRSSTKTFAHFPGVKLLAAVHQEIRLPTFAIGGINADNLAQVLATGVRRIAVGAAVVDQSDPAGATRRLLAMLEN